MKTNIKFSKLSIKKIRRTLLRSPLQFSAILIIVILASTLFSGFYASAYQFQDQVNSAFVLSNTADISTTVNVNDENKDVKKEYEGLKTLIGDRGKVETRNSYGCKINGYDNYVCLYDSYPTISKDYKYYGSDNKENNYFVIDYRYSHSKNDYGTNWLNEDGSYKPATVSFPVGKIRDDITEEKGTSKETINSFLNSSKYLKPNKKNILDNSFINLSITPTGTMHNADNISHSSTWTPYSILDRKLFNTALKTIIEDNFIVGTEEPSNEVEHEAWNLINNPSRYITDEYYLNNQYLTKLNDSSLTNVVKGEIFNYFKNKENDNLILNTDRDHSSASRVIVADVKQTIILCYVFPSIFLLVGLFITATTFSQLILKERNEIGTLKAMGVPSYKIILYYIALGLIVSIAGCLLGIIIGPFIVPNIMNIKVKNLYYVPQAKLIFPFIPSLILLIVTILVTALVIYITVKKETRLSPSFSLRPVLPKSIKSKTKTKIKTISLYKFLISSLKINDKKKILSFIKEGKITVNKQVIYDKKYKIDILKDNIRFNNEIVNYRSDGKFIPFKLAIRNIRCSLLKSFIVVIGISACTAILGGSFGISDSLNYGFAGDVRRFITSDINVTFSYPDQSTVDAFKDLKDKTHQIEKMEPYSALPATITRDDNKEVSFTSTLYTVDPSSSFINLKEYDLRYRQILVTKKVAEDLDLTVGTLVNFRTLGKDYYATVIGVMDTFYVQGIFASRHWLEKLYASVTGLYIKTNKDVVKNNKEFADELLKIKGVANYFEYERNIASMSNAFKSLSYITLLLKAFAIALAIVVLYNFVVLNYKQRMKDICTMKVLGFNSFQFGLSMILEILMLSLIGVTIGLCCSLPFEMLILSINKNDIIYFSYYMSPVSYVYSFLISILTAVLVSLFIIIRNKKVKMIDSLKSVE